MGWLFADDVITKNIKAQKAAKKAQRELDTTVDAYVEVGVRIIEAPAVQRVAEKLFGKNDDDDKKDKKK